MQRRALAPLFARRSVMSFTGAVTASADALIARLRRREGDVVDLAAEVTRLTLDVLERTIFSDGIGADREDIRIAMQRYFEVASRIDPFDILGLPAAIPRPRRLHRVRRRLRFFETTIDTLIATRRRAARRRARARAARSADAAPRTPAIRKPAQGLSEAEVRANVLTFIAAGHETTANCLTWSLYLCRSRRNGARACARRPSASSARTTSTTLADRLVETRAVIDEANRLYPPISAISRVALGPDDARAATPIGRGTMVVIAPYVLHRHRTLWTRAGLLRSEPLPARRAREHRPLRLSAVRRGPAHLHRLDLRVAGSLRHVGVAGAQFRLELAPGHTVWPVQKMTLRPDGGMPMILRRRG